MKYINADELKFLINEIYPDAQDSRTCGEMDALNKVYDLIDSLQQEQGLIFINKKDWEAQEQFRKNKVFGKPLQQEQQEEPDKSLEEEVKNYFQGYWPGTETVEQCNTDLHFTPPAIIRLASHFAEWQKKQDLAEMAQSKSPLSVAYANRCFENGKQAMKEQMLKEAVEGTYAVTTVGHFAFFPDKPIKDLCFGDKVRIVVLKEEEEYGKELQ